MISIHLRIVLLLIFCFAIFIIGSFFLFIKQQVIWLRHLLYLVFQLFFPILYTFSKNLVSPFLCSVLIFFYFVKGLKQRMEFADWKACNFSLLSICLVEVQSLHKVFKYKKEFFRKFIVFFLMFRLNVFVDFCIFVFVFKFRKKKLFFVCVVVVLIFGFLDTVGWDLFINVDFVQLQLLDKFGTIDFFNPVEAGISWAFGKERLSE